MATQRDYYEVLEIERTATGAVISKAYRKLAIKYHPDKNQGDDEAIRMFKEASEAFEVLNNDDKRAAYDRYGHAGVQQGGSAGFGDVEDIFSAFGDLFGDLFGGRSGGAGRTRKGRDVRCDVTLTLHEVANGITKQVKISRHQPCNVCEGSGDAAGSSRETCQYCGGHGRIVQQAGIVRMQTTCPSCNGEGSITRNPCKRCKGTGQTLRTDTTEVDIPAGVDDGMKLRIAGMGEASASGGPPGDCYCFIAIKEHPLFYREGQHLVCHVPITYPQAALGCTLEVPTLDGKDELEIHAGTQSGDVFRLKGRGMPDPRRRGLGDLHVQVTIEVPKKLDEEEERLLRELAEVEQANVSPKRRTFYESLKNYFSSSDDSVVEA